MEGGVDSVSLVGSKSLISRNPALSIALIIAAISSVGLLVIFTQRQILANDFGVYWRVSNESPSLAYLPRRHNPFVYPPTMLLWISPLSLIPKWPAFAAWVAISVAALVYSVKRYLDYRQIALLLLCPAAIHCISTGQVSALLTCLMLVAFSTDSRVAAGAVLAVVATIKPQYVAVAPLYLAMNREWKCLVWTLATSLAVVVISIITFGQITWIAWIKAIPSFHEVLLRDGVLHVAITPAAVAERIGLSPLLAEVSGALIAVTLVVFSRPSDPIGKTALVSTASMLCAPYALVYDLLPICPFLVGLIFRGRITAAVALSGALSPLPLLISGYELFIRPLPIVRTYRADRGVD